MDRIPIGEGRDEPDNVVRLPGAEAGSATGHEGPDPADDEMSYEDALAADEADGDDEEPDGRPTPGAQVAGLVEQGVRVGAGLFAAGASALADALRATMPRDPEQPSSPDPAATVAGAGMGAAITAAEAAAGAARQVADTVGPAITWLLEPRFAKDAGDVAAGAARVLDGQWKASQAEAVGSATSFLKVLVPEIATALANQVDLTELVRERVDVNAIVDDVDIERILERIDLDEVVRRVDVDAIVDRVDLERVAEKVPVDAVLDRVDLDAVVDRVDVDRIVARTDLRAIVDRIDVSAIALEVIDDVDLPRVIRESTGAMAGETVRTARIQGMHADRLVARVIDAVIRREARDLTPDDRPTDRSGDQEGGT